MNINHKSILISIAALVSISSMYGMDQQANQVSNSKDLASNKAVIIPSLKNLCMRATQSISPIPSEKWVEQKQAANKPATADAYGQEIINQIKQLPDDQDCVFGMRRFNADFITQHQEKLFDLIFDHNVQPAIRSEIFNKLPHDFLRSKKYILIAAIEKYCNGDSSLTIPASFACDIAIFLIVHEGGSVKLAYELAKKGPITPHLAQIMYDIRIDQICNADKTIVNENNFEELFKIILPESILNHGNDQIIGTTMKQSFKDTCYNTPFLLALAHYFTLYPEELASDNKDFSTHIFSPSCALEYEAISPYFGAYTIKNTNGSVINSFELSTNMSISAMCNKAAYTHYVLHPQHSNIIVLYNNTECLIYNTDVFMQLLYFDTTRLGRQIDRITFNKNGSQFGMILDDHSMLVGDLPQELLTLELNLDQLMLMLLGKDSSKMVQSVRLKYHQLFIQNFPRLMSSWMEFGQAIIDNVQVACLGMELTNCAGQIEGKSIGLEEFQQIFADHERMDRLMENQNFNEIFMQFGELMQRLGQPQEPSQESDSDEGGEAQPDNDNDQQ